MIKNPWMQRGAVIENKKSNEDSKVLNLAEKLKEKKKKEDEELYARVISRARHIVD